MASLIERLRELRKINKLTQKDVGDYLGISESAYGYYEQGRNEPSINAVKKLAKKYNVSSSYIMGDTDNPTPESEEEDFQDFINDPELQRWYKDLPKSNEEDLQKLRKMWEIIKSEGK